MGFWDSNEAKLAPSGDWFKFVTSGDSIEGKIDHLSIREFTRDDGSPNHVVEVTFSDGRKVTASQAMLARRIYEERPEIGDWLEITYTGEQQLSPTRKMKTFEVVVKKADQATQRNGGPRKATATPKKSVTPDDDEVPF